MSLDSKRIASVVVLIFAMLGMSGCVTKKLNNSIREHENGVGLYSSDNISAATFTQSGKDNYRWVFIGEHFNYSLTSGADDFLRALAMGKIDKSRITLSREGPFTLNKEKNKFSGDIELTYHYRTNAEREQISEYFPQSSWGCEAHAGVSAVCTIRLANLTGTIHQKSAVPSDLFYFSHPIKVNFYTSNTLSAKRALYPVAVATDVVLSPLYLIGFVTGFAVYSAALL